MSKLVHLLCVLCVCWLGGGRVSAQSCGVWLDGPANPDLPPDSQVVQLVAVGQQLFALTRFDDSGRRIWRFAGGSWTQLPWDETLGAPATMVSQGAQIAVATARIVGTQGGFNTWQLAVRVFDGTAWQAAAVGTIPIDDGWSLLVTDLALYSGSWHCSVTLSAGTLSTISTGLLLRFDQSGITTLATTEIGNCYLCLDVVGLRQLEVYNGKLYVGGKFAAFRPTGGTALTATNLVQWTGSAWQAVAGGTDGPVRGIASLPTFTGLGYLVFWGNFTHAGTVAASHIALYNPFNSQWSAMGAGLTYPPEAVTTVVGLEGPFDIDLLAAGVYGSGSTTMRGFARWTGTTWQEFGGAGVDGAPRAIANVGGTIIAGGSDLRWGADPLFGVARWTGSRWGYVGSNGTDARVLAVQAHAGAVYAGGEFTTMDGVPAMHIARHSDAGWEALGAGMNGPVAALASYGGELIAAGSFTAAGGVPANSIAAWNGTAWHALGNGLNDAVRGLAVWNGRLVAVGDFGMSGSVPVTAVAQWNGTAWSAVDPSFNLIDLHVACVHNNELYIGGDEPCDVRRFDGAHFQVVGGGVNGSVYALASLAGSLYVGGSFTSVGANLPYRRVARWTGTQWLALAMGTNDFTSGAVRALVPASDELFVGGDFQVHTGTGYVQYMVRWNGVDWRGLAPGQPYGQVRAAALRPLPPAGTRLWIGGDFIEVGFDTVSAHIAQWSQAPVFLEQPQPVRMCQEGGTAVFSATPATEEGVTLRWQRNGMPLSNGLRISGALTNELTVYGVVEADEGVYTCVATDACSATTASAGAMLTVGGCCTADFNGDGSVNSQDFFDFLTAFFASAPTADFNHDGAINSQDFFDFLGAFFVGC